MRCREIKSLPLKLSDHNDADTQNSEKRNCDLRKKHENPVRNPKSTMADVDLEYFVDILAQNRIQDNICNYRFLCLPAAASHALALAEMISHSID